MSVVALVDEPATTAGSGDIGAVNRAMAVSATIGNRQTGAVMVATMALQAQGRLAHIQQIGVRRTMWHVAQHAILAYRWVLVRKRSAILCVAAETKLVQICIAQVLSGCASMRVMAIDASQLSFTIGVMVGQTTLGSLCLMTPQTVLNRLSAGLEGDATFRSE